MIVSNFVKSLSKFKLFRKSFNNKTNFEKISKIWLILLVLLIIHTLFAIRNKIRTSNLPKSEGSYNPCLVQVYGSKELKNGQSVFDASARLSLWLSYNFSKIHDYKFLLYDCMKSGLSGKPPSIWDACYTQTCSHVLFIDADVFIHDTRVDVIRVMTDLYPDSVMMTGVDYYHTMKAEFQHNGDARLWRTDSNTGMLVFDCKKPLSKHILVEWERLTNRFSPFKDDQESITLMETLPQYKSTNAFVRDAFILGMYSVIARHIAGPTGKKGEYPVTQEQVYKNKDVLKGSRLLFWIHYYWTKIRKEEVPLTENWRLSNDTKGWIWEGPEFQACPLDSNNSTSDLLKKHDLVDSTLNTSELLDIAMRPDRDGHFIVTNDTG